jgi:hypothetical protein
MNMNASITILRLFCHREVRILREALAWHILEREEASNWHHGGLKAANDSQIAKEILGRLNASYARAKKCDALICETSSHRV